MAKSVYYSLAVLSIALLQLVNTNAIYSRRCHSRDEYYNPAKRSCQKLCTPCEPGFVEVFRCVAPLRMPTICRQFDEILNRIPKTYTSDYLKISHNLRQRTIRQGKENIFSILVLHLNEKNLKSWYSYIFLYIICTFKYQIHINFILVYGKMERQLNSFIYRVPKNGWQWAVSSTGGAAVKFYIKDIIFSIYLGIIEKEVIKIYDKVIKKSKDYSALFSILLFVSFIFWRLIQKFIHEEKFKKGHALLKRSKFHKCVQPNGHN